MVPDVDECATNNGGCSQQCIDTSGSFTCDCDEGYALNVDGSSCDGKYERFLPAVDLLTYNFKIEFFSQTVHIVNWN